MSTEPKFPKRGYSPYYKRSVVAPEGYYLLGGGETLQPDDLMMSTALHTRLGDHPYTGWVTRPSWVCIYARRLPEGQPNDDPPAQHSGKWAYSTDEENYQGECDSAEAAFIEGAGQNGLEGLEDDQTLYVGQIDEPDPVPGITADRVLEWVEEYLSDEAPDSIDEILPRPSAVQKAALEEALRSAYRGWLAANPDQKPQWFRIKGKVQEKTGAEIRELSAPET